MMQSRSGYSADIGVNESSKKQKAPNILVLVHCVVSGKVLECVCVFCFTIYVRTYLYVAN